MTADQRMARAHAATAPAASAGAGIGLRDPDTVMTLARLGAAFPSRLSVMPTLIRRLRDGGWRFARHAFDLDASGEGVALYTAWTDSGSTGSGGPYTLVAFGHDITPEQRTDRVIAEAWDSTFVLYDGVPDDAEIDRLRGAVPLQEAGRFAETDLILSRANKSVRLFDHVVDSLAAGRQPDPALLSGVGYLMRTSAVYGNGKFGIADRDVVLGRPEFAGAFLAEMLTVYLIRWFSHDLAAHMARQRDPARAVPLDAANRRRLGIGNSTGLGMAPFLVSHPTLLHLWIKARERALQAARSLAGPAPAQVARFRTLLAAARRHLALWRTGDPLQSASNAEIAADLDRLTDWLATAPLADHPFETIHRHLAAEAGIATQEMVASLLIDALGPAADACAEGMIAPAEPPLDPAMRLGALQRILATDYAWAAACATRPAEAETYFWYRSETKQEPRLGRRDADDGAALAMHVDIAQQANALRMAIAARDPQESVAALVLERPDLRAICHRVQLGAAHPYGEIRDNLLAGTMRPIDLLRCKLAVFGATRFDPKSDRWLQVAMFQGAPLPDAPGQDAPESADAEDDAWWLAGDIAPAASEPAS